MPGGIYPHWSTINKLVYLRDGIYIRDVVSQEERKVPISPYTSIQRAKWSPDGTKLVYSAYRDDNWDIYVHDLGSGRDTRLTGGFADQMPGWSPTGEQIVWTCSTFEPPAGQQLYVMNADGTEKRRLFSENYDGSYGATWSPDGKKIAFIAPTGVDNSDILVFDFQKGLRNVTKHLKGRQGNPSWSPDSTSLAFSGSVEGQFENWDIYVLNLDSGAAKTVVASPTETEWCPAWSPLGNEVAYSIQDTRTRMLRNLVLVLSTGMSRVLPEPAENEISCGTWSPDGRYLAFQGYGKQEGQIVLLDMSRGVFEIVAHSARRPTWAADPDKLYFVTSNGDVVRMSLADRTISLQARTGDLDVNLRSFAVSPDGRYIVIVENLLPGVGTMRWGLFIHDTVSGTRRELVPGLSMYLINDVVWAR